MASVYILTVNSIERPLRLGSLSFQGVVNGRDVMSCSILSEEGAYRPTLAHEVVLTEDGTPIFGGVIRMTEEEGADQQPIDTIATRITCDSFNVFAERRFVTETIPAGSTLKQALQILDDYLTDYGVTLDAGQVDGPTLDAAWEIYGTPLNTVLDTLSDRTDGTFVWEIDPSKTFRMFEVGTEASPFDIIDTDLPAKYVGDIMVSRSREKYVNRVIVKGGTNIQVDKTDAFTGDGSEDTFELTYPLVYTPQVGYGYVTNGDDPAHPGEPNNETLDLAGNGATWTYDPATNTIIRAAGAPANLNAISITYPAQFPIFVTVEDAGEIAANGLYEAAFEYQDVFDKAVLDELAASLLSRGLEIKTEVTLSTREPGIMPGMTLTLTASDRGVTGDFYVNEISARTEASTDHIIRTLKLIEGSQLRGTFRGLIKAWLGGGSGGVSSISAPVVSSGGGAPAPPNRSVQFNRAGAFGGDASFTYDEETNSVVCGLDSSISAADHESCQVWGNNCHIVDV